MFFFVVSAGKVCCVCLVSVIFTSVVPLLASFTGALPVAGCHLGHVIFPRG